MGRADRLWSLVEVARRARARAYAPYSKFKIGDSALASGGRVFSGCNVENSSYGLSCCAERAAIFKAVSEGSRSILAIAIVGAQKSFTRPCDACRQVMAEFNTEVKVHMRGTDGFSEDTTAEDLLPGPFLPGAREQA
ncbi:MAG: cytidine deaminase [Thaumarchaeota archaeon]|nr:cytidine deaminase [Nitrososphaerota archaeon]